MTFQTIPESEYFALDALSASGLKLLSDCPAKYRYAMDHPTAPTSAMAMGTATHSLVLEPEKQSVIICDNGRTTKAFAALQDENPSKLVVTGKEHEIAYAMANALRGNPYVRELLKSGKPEQTATYRNGVFMKARFDWVCVVRDLIVDIKTTADASPEGFGKQLFNLKYHWQAYWYTHLYELVTGRKATFIIACVENKAPYLTAVYQVPQEVISYAAQQVLPIIELYKECVVLNDWPGYDACITAFEIPAWINIEMEYTT